MKILIHLPIIFFLRKDRIVIFITIIYAYSHVYMPTLCQYINVKKNSIENIQ